MLEQAALTLQEVRAVLKDEYEDTRRGIRETFSEVKEELRQTVGGLEPALLSVREAMASNASAPILAPVWEKAPRPPSADELRKRTHELVGKVMGGGQETNGAEHLCEFLALPFVHGPALQPEIRKLQSALDHCPAEASLRTSLETLRALEAQLDAHGPLLPSSASPSQEGGESGASRDATTSSSIAEVSANAVQRVTRLLQRECLHDAKIAAAADAAAVRASAGRAEFVKRVDAGLALGAVRSGGRVDSRDDLTTLAPQKE